MIPAVTGARLSGAARRSELPLLVLGPSLGTSARTLWTACAAGLTDVFDVLAWDLPGHGYNRGVPDEPFTMAELAAGVLRVVDDVLAERGDATGPFYYAGDSVGGCVGLQLLLDAPTRVTSAVLLCTGARIGTPDLWAGRIGQVTISGTAVMVTGSAQRWFGPGFLAQEPERAAALLQALEETDDDGYLHVCTALAEFDMRDRLGEVTAPVLAVAGAHDVTTPPDLLRQIADGVPDGRLVVLDGVAHLAPAEAPEAVARLLREHLLGEEPSEDVADFTREVETVVGAYAAGDLDARPGLDPRSRSLVTLAVLVARGDRERFAHHLAAAHARGVTAEETTEVLLQAAALGSVADATAAYRLARTIVQAPS